MSNLSTKAMLVRLTVGGWSGSVFDRNATRIIHEQSDADEDSGKYNKRLLPREALKAINKAGNAARLEHYRMTMPWDDGGSRLLPVKVYKSYQRTIDEYINQRATARGELVKMYPGYKAEAKESLGDLFNEADYPEIGKLESMIVMEYKFSPVPEAKHFIADLSKAEADKIKVDIEKQIETKLNVAVSSLYSRIGTAIRSCLERLEPKDDGSQKVFRDSLIGNLWELIEICPQLNLTQDPDLKKMLAGLKKTLRGIDADSLRTSSPGFVGDKRRDKFHQDLADLNTKFAGYFSGAQS